MNWNLMRSMFCERERIYAHHEGLTDEDQIVLTVPEYPQRDASWSRSRSNRLWAIRTTWTIQNQRAIAYFAHNPGCQPSYVCADCWTVSFFFQRQMFPNIEVNYINVVLSTRPSRKRRVFSSNLKSAQRCYRDQKAVTTASRGSGDRDRGGCWSRCWRRADKVKQKVDSVSISSMELFRFIVWISPDVIEWRWLVIVARAQADSQADRRWTAAATKCLVSLVRRNMKLRLKLSRRYCAI